MHRWPQRGKFCEQALYPPFRDCIAGDQFTHADNPKPRDRGNQQRFGIACMQAPRDGFSVGLSAVLKLPLPQPAGVDLRVGQAVMLVQVFGAFRFSMSFEIFG